MSSTTAPSSLVSIRPRMMRASTAPERTSAETKRNDPEIQWLHDGNCSRPPTPHAAKRMRLLRGPSPMKLHSAPIDDNAGETKNSDNARSQSTSFPILPNLVRTGGSRLGKKFSRRMTPDNNRSLSKSARHASIEFDKLESLANVAVSNKTTKNHHQYGSSSTEVQKTRDDTNRDRRSSTAGGRRLSMSNFESPIKNLPSTLNATGGHSKSAFLDFFRRGSGASSALPINMNQPKGFDDLSKSKPVVAVGDSVRKKSDVHVVMTMQPRSPRYRSGRASLSEIERLISLSQRRRDAAIGGAVASSTPKDSRPRSIDDRGVNGRMKALKIDN